MPGLAFGLQPCEAIRDLGKASLEGRVELIMPRLQFGLQHRQTIRDLGKPRLHACLRSPELVFRRSTTHRLPGHLLYLPTALTPFTPDRQHAIENRGHSEKGCGCRSGKRNQRLGRHAPSVSPEACRPPLFQNRRRDPDAVRPSLPESDQERPEVA
jgi:hypothetical protein